MMACKHDRDFDEFFREVAPFVSHIHLADSQGVDGKGVVTSCGDFNFTEFRDLIETSDTNVPLVIEEWQGHMNNGNGFVNALTFLSNVRF